MQFKNAPYLNTVVLFAALMRGRFEPVISKLLFIITQTFFVILNVKSDMLVILVCI